MFKKKHPLVKRVFNVLLEKKFDGAYINRMYQENDILYTNIHLPEHKELSDLEKILPNLQQEMNATAVKLGKTSGKYVEILFGMKALGEITFHESLLVPNTLKLKLPSAYGEAILDFEDGASCHMLNGGVTRMGKTCFLLYLATTLFLQNNGKLQLYISSAKLKDYYPFEGIPQVKMTREINEMEGMLDEIIEEYKKRDQLLYSPSFQKATDAKSVRKLYPDSYHLFQPIFLIIDEYARFAESKNIQKMVTEIVETAGFVNIHVIIASQRPDAATVLRPRIRANLLARMAFTTADRKNSEVILDREGAEKLGKIPGRGMLLDSDLHVIQIPYLDVVECDKLLEGYRNEQITKGCSNHETIEQIQSPISESDSMDGLFGEFKPNQCHKPGFAEDVFGWEDTANPKGKG